MSVPELIETDNLPKQEYVPPDWEHHDQYPDLDQKFPFSEFIAEVKLTQILIIQDHLLHKIKRNLSLIQ